MLGNWFSLFNQNQSKHSQTEWLLFSHCSVQPFAHCSPTSGSMWSNNSELLPHCIPRCSQVVVYILVCPKILIWNKDLEGLQEKWWSDKILSLPVIFQWETTIFKAKNRTEWELGHTVQQVCGRIQFYTVDGSSKKKIHTVRTISIWAPKIIIINSVSDQIPQSALLLNS